MGNHIVYPVLPSDYHWVGRLRRFPLPKYYGEIHHGNERYRTRAFTARGFRRALTELATQVWAIDTQRRMHD